MNFGEKEFTRKKNRIKFFRVILQIVILCFLGLILANALFTFKSYIPYQERNDVPISNDKGFIALSYFGVTPTGTDTLIANDRLNEHLTALRDCGYVTIAQQDVIDYYEQGKVLPEKALFLMFEDGRRDTAVFAQKILEELNYKGIVLTYADRINFDEPNFLKTPELKDLRGNGFWELGTNGYRLAFINCFDRYDNYLGELSRFKFAMVGPYMGKYNHYLMDYLRDEHDFPKESYNLMQDRISYDYERMRDIYAEGVGEIPKTYILMHSNTGAFGNNKEVSAVNEKWITELFKMNFNREGLSWNNRDSSIYDLTRMQPQPHWYVNHLLMRIAHDQNQSVNFVLGNASEAAKWIKKTGQAEYREQKIVLTTNPYADSLIQLDDMRSAKNIKLNVRLTGNKYGMQSVYLRVVDKLQDAVGVHVLGNELFVTESDECLLTLDLNEFEGIKVESVDENKKAAEVMALCALARYAKTKAQAEIYTKRMLERQSRSSKSVEEGSEPYVHKISVREFGDRNLELLLHDDVLNIKVNGKLLDRDIIVKNVQKGKIALGAMMDSKVYYTDDVYDGVFENLKVTDYDLDKEVEPIVDFKFAGYEFKVFMPWDENEDAVLYDSKLKGVDGMLHTLGIYWEKVLHIFVHGY